MANTIDRTVDELAIRNLLAELAWQADSKSLDEVDGYVDCFTADATWEGPGEVRTGRDDIRAGVVQRRSATEGEWATAKVAHFVATTAVAFDDDDSARAKSYVQAYRLAPGEAPMLIMVCKYRDQFLRTGEGWKLNHRRIEMS